MGKIQLEVDYQASFQMQPIFIVVIVKKVTMLQSQITFLRNNMQGLYVIKCKECNKDIKIIRRSYLVPSVVWYDCGCHGGNNLNVPEHIPMKQIKRYLNAQLQTMY